MSMPWFNNVMMSSSKSITTALSSPNHNNTKNVSDAIECIPMLSSVDEYTHVTTTERSSSNNSISLTNGATKQQLSSSLLLSPKTSCNSNSSSNRLDVENGCYWDHSKSSSSSSPQSSRLYISRSASHPSVDILSASTDHPLPPRVSLDTSAIIEKENVPCHPSSSFTNNSSNNNLDDFASVNNGNSNSNASHIQSYERQRRQQVFQLLFGAIGVYCTYLYYAHVQEELFHYRDPIQHVGFLYVWFLQVLESAISIVLGWYGRRYYSMQSNDSDDNTTIKSVNVKDRKMPFLPFMKSGASQLFGKVFMSLSLAHGLAFPVVVLAKSGKVVPVMIGQMLLGGSTYHIRDYIFSILLVVGTAMLSMNSTDTDSENQDTSTTFGVIFLILSLFLDGLTGGLQKKLKNETALYEPNAYDFLYYSHITMFTISLVMCQITGEFHNAISYCTNNPNIWIWLVASCACSSIGQCFIFYIIATFDPFVCTTITTTRKMISVLFSIFWKGHVEVSNIGMIGLLSAFIALLIEIEGKMRYHIPKNTKNNIDQS